MKLVVTALVAVALAGSARAQDVAEPAAPPPPGEGGIEALSIAAPAPAWKEWEISGNLIDDVSVIRGFLAAQMEASRQWDESAELEVRELLLRLSYQVRFRKVTLPGGGLKVVLHLTPVPLVRSVRMSVDMPNTTRIWDPIFQDELRRRMRLRAGSPLSIEPVVRNAELEEEARRLESYLIDEGFNDALVSITSRQTARFGVTLDVAVRPGPPYTLGKITIVGNQSIDSSEILPHFRDDRVLCLLGGCRRFTKRQLNLDVQEVVKLYRERGYPGVTVKTDYDPRHSFHRDKKTVEITVSIRERRKIDIVFDGLGARLREDRLAEELTLDEEGSYDDVELDDSAAAVRRYLQNQGYFEANVVWERERFGVFERVIMTVDQGPKLEIKEVAFAGNQALDEDTLRGVVKTKRYRRLGLGETGGYATSEQLAADIAALTKRYHAAGFPEAVVEVRVARRPELLDSAAAHAAAAAAQLPTSGLWVRYQITEGPRVLVSEVAFDVAGQAGPSPAALRKNLALRRGRVFATEQVDADRERLREAYSAAGFPSAEVETEVRRGAAADRRVVVHHVTPGPQVRIGKIAVRGNFRTRDWVIREELGVTEGDLLSSRSFERLRTNLQSSGLFGSVQVEEVGRPGQPIVNLVVRVEERHDDRGAFELGLGYATNTAYYWTIGYELANLFGIGANLHAAVTLPYCTGAWMPGVGQRCASLPLLGELDGDRTDAEVRLRLPRWIGRRLFGLGIELETNGFYQKIDTERFGAVRSWGGGVAASYELRGGFVDRWRVALRYDYRHSSRKDELVRPAGNSDDLPETDGVTSVSSSVGPELTVDRRTDLEGRFNPLSAARGYMVYGRAAYADDVLGTDRFIKLSAAGQYLLPVGTRFQLSTSIVYDQGFPLGGKVLLPEIERFFAGGDTTVRGFAEDRLATEVISDPLMPGSDARQIRVLPAGGNIRLVYRLDLQTKVWELASLPVAAAVFLDTGIVTNTLAGFRPRDLRHALGVSLFRWVTPVGNMSVDFAVPLDPQIGDNPLGRVHFTLGATLGL